MESKRKLNAVQIRLTQGERDSIAVLCKSEGLSLTEWIRRRIEATPITQRLERIEAILTDLQRRIA